MGEEEKIDVEIVEAYLAWKAEMAALQNPSPADVETVQEVTETKEPTGPADVAPAALTYGHPTRPGVHRFQTVDQVPKGQGFVSVDTMPPEVEDGPQYVYIDGGWSAVSVDE